MEPTIPGLQGMWLSNTPQRLLQLFKKYSEKLSECLTVNLDPNCLQGYQQKTKAMFDLSY